MLGQVKLLEQILADMQSGVGNQRYELGIDEFTLVLRGTAKVVFYEWQSLAETIIMEFLEKSRIVEIFGDVEPSVQGLVQGYTTGYKLESCPFYFCICYNEEMENMGICVKFSAYAWASYKIEYYEKYKERIDLPDFLRMIQSDTYKQRLSRIDLTYDLFNMPDPINHGKYLHPHTIYDLLTKRQIVVVDHKDHANIKTISSINNDGVFETCYIGSRRGNTSGFMRIYDKRSEQIQKKSFRYEDSLGCDSWLRLESVYKHPYSDQIQEALMGINSQNELSSFIAGKFVDKYNFKFAATNEKLYFSELLILVASQCEYDVLSSPSARDIDLRQSLKYLIKNSGLMSTLAKAYSIYDGEKTVKQILEWIYKMLFDYYFQKIMRYENNELEKWLKKHGRTAEKIPIDELLESISIEIEKDDEWDKGINLI